MTVVLCQATSGHSESSIVVVLCQAKVPYYVK